MKFRKKEVFEAYQCFKGSLDDDVVPYSEHYLAIDNGGDICPKCKNIFDEHVWIDTIEDQYIVCPGEWIVTGTKGERFSMEDQVFKDTYEPI